MTDIAALEERLRVIEDERSIQRTMYKYGHSLDYGDEETFMDCWAEGAILEWPITGYLEGRDAIRAGFSKHSHAPEKWHKHLLVEPVITIEGERAKVESMFLRVDLLDGRPVLHTFGRYKDTLVRCADGEWRFTHRLPIPEAVNPDLGIIFAKDRDH